MSTRFPQDYRPAIPKDSPRPARRCPTLSSMSGSGQPFNHSVLVPAPPAAVMHLLLSLPPGGNYFDGYELRQVTGNSVHITRRYVPAWAIVAAIVGAVFFLLGGLVLLVRETEVLTITVYEQDEDSYLEFSGMAAPRIATAANLAVDRLLSGVAMAPPAAAFPASSAVTFPASSAPSSPASTADPLGPADDKICPECAETVRSAARRCRFCGYRFSAEPA